MKSELGSPHGVHQNTFFKEAKLNNRRVVDQQTGPLLKEVGGGPPSLAHQELLVKWCKHLLIYKISK
jgi:hypothetical protein